MKDGKLRKMGIEVIGDAPWGTHFCLFYQTKEDLIDILVPYFKAGLENNEFCMWVTSEPLNVDDAERALQRVVENLDDYVEKGQIEILDYRQWYTKSGRFDADEVLQGWVEKESQAVKRGFDGLRLTGNTFWLEERDWEAFTNYEAEIDRVIGQYRMLALCTYSLDRCRASEVIDVVSNHEFALIKREGKWETIESARRKRAQEALAHERDLLQALMDNIPDTIYFKDTASRFTRINRAQAQVLGIKDPKEATGKTDFDFFTEEHAQNAYADEQEIVKSGQPLVDKVERIRKADGQIRWVSATKVPILDEKGQVTGIVGISRDITERQRAEEALRERVKELTCLYTVNRAMREDLSVDELCRRIIEHLVPAMQFPEITAAVIELDSRRFTSGRYTEGLSHSLQAEIRVEGEVRGRLSVYCAEDRPFIIPEEQNLLNMIGEDFGLWLERKRAEEALRESEERFRRLAENAQDLIYRYRFTPTPGFEYVSPAATDITGYTPEEHYADPDLGLKIVHPDDQSQLEKYFQGEGVFIQPIVLRWMKKDGTVIWTEQRNVPIYDQAGDLVALEGIARDITARKRAEEALRVSEERFALAVRGSDAGIWDWDIQNHSLYWSPRLKELLGYADDELDIDFDTFESHLHPDDRERTATAIEAHLKDRELYQVEQRLRTKSGEYRWFLARGQALWDENGNPLRMVGSTTDITDRKRAEEEVRRHLERIEALREIDIAITSTLDLTKVLDIILEELERVIPYHSAGIFLFSNDTARLAAGRGFPDMERVLQVSFPIEEDALTCDLLREKRPLVLADAQADERFLARGGTEYVRSWIGVPLIAKGEATGFLSIDHREPGIYGEERAEMAQAFASQAAIAIENARLFQEAQRELAERKRAEEELQRALDKLRKTLDGIIQAITLTVEARDSYTAGHQRRVSDLARAIATEMHLPEEQIHGIRMAGLIHDLGKINVPAEILSKPVRLNDLEYGLVKTHPRIGYDILKTIDFPWPVAEIVLQHHERLDGSGYPQGLSGEKIMLEARILAVADVVEAMASHRPYRSARGLDEALDEISQNRGILYDSEVVDVCLKLFIEKGFTFE